MSGDATTRPDIPPAWTAAALDAVIAHHKQRRDPIWNCPSSGEVAAIITALRPLIAAAERERIRRGVLAREMVMQHPADGDRVAVLTLDLEQVIGAEDGSDG